MQISFIFCSSFLLVTLSTVGIYIFLISISWNIPLLLIFKYFTDNDSYVNFILAS